MCFFHMAAYACTSRMLSWLNKLLWAPGGVAATEDEDQYVYFTVWPQTHVSA